MVVRTTLLYGSCSVSDQPEVWQWVRSIIDLGFCGLNCFHDPPPQQARRASWRSEIEVHAHRPEERQATGELVHVHAAGDAGAHVLEAVGKVNASSMAWLAPASWM